MAQKIIAVAYYRMSSDKQETSISDQRTAVEEYAKQNGYKIIREYADEGVSGWKTNQRKAFQELIDDAQKRGDFKAVLCWDQDRFSRFDPMEANHYWYLLDKAGVHLATVAQGRHNWHDLGGWLTASVQQHGKAQYVKDLARNTTRGLRKRKLAGQWVGCAPYGYALKDGQLVLGDPEQVDVVRRIFHERVKGYGLTTIARKLNSDGIETPRRAGWSTQSVKHILQRDAYIGNTVVGKHARGKFDRITEEPVTIENTHPAIIDRKTWDRVQAMPRQKRHVAKRWEGGRLAGLLTCGMCGLKMYAHRSLERSYYTCSGYMRGSTCGCCRLTQDCAERAVFRKIREEVLMGSRSRLEDHIRKQLEASKQCRPTGKSRKNELAKIDRQIERAADRLLTVDEELVSDLQQRLKAMKEKRENLAASVAEQESSKRPQPSAKVIAGKLWEIDRIMREASPVIVRNALRQMVEDIRFDFEFSNTTPRGYNRFRCVGGAMRLRKDDSQHGETLSTLGLG